MHDIGSKWIQSLLESPRCPDDLPRYSFFYNDPSRGRVYAGLRVGYDASVIAPHPDMNADIVIGTEADFGPCGDPSQHDAALPD